MKKVLLIIDLLKQLQTHLNTSCSAASPHLILSENYPMGQLVNTFSSFGYSVIQTHKIRAAVVKNRANKRNVNSKQIITINEKSDLFQ